MITYEAEKLTDELILEITPILDVHRKELQSFSDMHLNPAWDMYRSVEENGDLLLLVARDNGVLVGYAGFVIHPNPHYSDFKYATQDVFYVVEDKRGSRIAVKLVKESERLLKDMKVDVITHHAKFINTFAPFLEKMGYHKTEVILAKRISN